MRRWLLIALAATPTLVAPALADDGPPAPPLPDERPRDFDADAERYSEFWEQALRPHAKEYDAKLRTAEVEVASFGQTPTKLDNAERLLKEAIALEPDRPTAHWVLGDLYERQERWAECATARRKVFDLDPGFQPPQRLTHGWELDRALADCLAMAGEYEDAIDHYKRILASGKTMRSYAHVKLAMVYMALGRIDDAIETYDQAIDDATTNPQGPRHAAFMYFGAAVANDRDERRARSEELLDLALRYDRTLSAFSSPENRFLLPSDELYFRGLAESTDPRRRAFAIAHFRRYQQVAGEDGWLRRAAQHLEALVGTELGDEDIAIRGAGVIDGKKARAAVLHESDALHACLESTPQLLFRVTLTKVATATSPRAGHDRRPPRTSPITPPQGGVRVRQELAFDTATRDVMDAQTCVTEAARRIRLPRVTGSLHSYATIELLLIAR